MIKSGATPDALVKAAVDEKRSRGKDLSKNDQIWLVFDRDEHADFDAAIQESAKNKFGVARSNPCFEVWLILHLEHFHRPDGRDAVHKYFCTLRPDYSAGKGRYCDFSGLIQVVAAAEERAQTQLEARIDEGAPFGRPSTTVHEVDELFERETR